MELELMLVADPQPAALAGELRRLRAENAALRYAATHDALTGLLNRAGLSQRADPLLAGAGSGICVSVMVLDLNWFKQVNDLLGHAAGDRVLQAVAYRLRANGGESWPLLARLGGDEFAGLRCGPEDPGRVRAHAAWLAAKLAAPMRAAGHELAVGAAIGVAVSDAPLGLGEMLRRADEAMYRAKSLAAPAAVVWDPHLDAAPDPGRGLRPRLRTRELRHLLPPPPRPAAADQATGRILTVGRAR
jgi:diguanylate cyclase (GGDEF)-like protein